MAAGRWQVAADHLAPARTVAVVEASLAARLDALEAQVALGQGHLNEADRLAAAALTVAEEADLPAVACEALEVTGRVAR